MKRANFLEPTELSAICNIHFSSDCYEESFMVEMWLIKQSPPLSGAIPTIQSPAATKSAGRVLRILFEAKMAVQLGHVYQENPSTNEQVADRQ